MWSHGSTDQLLRPGPPLILKTQVSDEAPQFAICRTLLTSHFVPHKIAEPQGTLVNDPRKEARQDRVHSADSASNVTRIRDTALVYSLAAQNLLFTLVKDFNRLCIVHRQAIDLTIPSCQPLSTTMQRNNLITLKSHRVIIIEYIHLKFQSSYNV